MTIEFKKEQIMHEETKNQKPFAGYFAPNGKLIDYSISLGGEHHDDWRNPVSMAFLSFVSYIVDGTKDYDMEYPGIDNAVIRGYGLWYQFNSENMDIFLKLLNNRIEYIKQWGSFSDEYTLFEYQLLLFFRNAYKNRRFFESIERTIKVGNPKKIKNIIREKYYKGREASYEDLEYEYKDYLKKELLSHLKDICVQYLGYDLLERFRPNGTFIDEPYKWEKYKNFNFLANPRVITSAYPNVNERYFEYLIRGWKVHQIPRYYYNERTGLYEQSDFHLYYQSDKEKRLEDEIESILASVPPEEIDDYSRTLQNRKNI